MASLKSSIGNNRLISLDDVCYLISETVVEDELGQDEVTGKTERPIFCSKLSITRAEATAAGQLNRNPKMLLVVDSDEYDQEGSLKYDGKTYSIYKDFIRTDGFTELYCEVKAGD